MELNPEVVQETIDIIQAYIIAWMPAIISGITAIVSVVKMFQQFKIVREEVKKNTDVQENMKIMSKTISDVYVNNASEKKEIMKAISDLTGAYTRLERRTTDLEVKNEKEKQDN